MAPGPVTEDFPRGGASVLTPLELKEVNLKAKEDVLFKGDDVDMEDIKPKKRQQQKDSRKRKSTPKEDDSEVSSKKSKRGITRAEVLKFKRLKIGSLLLGSIREINELDLVISLPHQLTGFIPITEISNKITEQVEKAAESNSESDDNSDEEDENELPDLKELFHVGQVLPVSVISLDDGTDGNGKKRIELSLKPEIVNAGYTAADLIEGSTLLASVSSVEDHGYILDLGIPTTPGFLHRKHTKTYLKSHSKDSLKVGQPIFVTVGFFNPTEEKTCHVVLDNTFSSIIKNYKTVTFDSLRPGMLVNGKVTSHLENGLLVSFMGIFEGTIDTSHLPMSTSTDIETSYPLQTQIKARIMYIDNAAKSVALTLLEHNISMEPFMFPKDLEIGTVLEKCVVTRVDSDMGVAIDCGNGMPGYVHISRLSDSKVDRIEKKWKVGSTHKGRVVNLGCLDGVVLVSFQPSVLAKQVLRYQDLKVGADMTGAVLAILPNNGGMLVSITDTIKALIPTNHITDVQLKNPEKKFKTGANIKFRILNVDVSGKKVLATCKKTLLNSSLPLFTTWDGITVGDVSHGTIVAIKPYGCMVQFYSGIVGLAPISELADEFIQDPTQHFRLGQPVKSRVIFVDANEEKLKVSFKLPSASLESLKSIVVGQIYEATVLSKTGDGLHVELNGTGQQKARGMLSKFHLGDHISLAEKAYNAISVNSNLQVVVLEKQKTQCIVSAKPLLLHTMTTNPQLFPTNLSGLKIDALVIGYVKVLFDNGVLIGFIGNETVAFVPKHLISDLFVNAISDHLRVGQTVVGKIVSMDLENSQVTCTLKSSQVFHMDSDEILEIEREFLKEWFSASSKTIATPFTIGAIVDGKVKQMAPYGIVVELENNWSGLITLDHQQEGSVLKVGDDVKAKILDMDLNKKIADLTVKSTLLNIAEPKLKKKSKSASTSSQAQLKKAFETKTKLDAVIQIVKEHYVVVTLLNGSVIAFAGARNPNVSSTPFGRFRVGQTVQTIVTSIPNDAASERVLLSLRAPEKKSSTSSSSNAADTRRHVSNAIDKTSTSLEDYTIGYRTMGKIKSIKDTQVNVTLADNLKGRIHISEIADSITDLSDVTRPFASLRNGQIIETKVIGFHDTKSHAYLPISHTNSISNTVVELTVKTSEMSAKGNGLVSKHASSLDDLEIGSQVIGYVHKTAVDAIWVYVSTTILGRIHLLEVSNSITDLSPEAIQRDFKVGKAVVCQVISKDLARNCVDLSIKSLSRGSKSAVSYESAQVGEILSGRVSSIRPAIGLTVQLGQHVYGRVGLTDISDVYSKEPTKAYSIGDLVSCYVMHVDIGRGVMDISLRASRTTHESESESKSEITPNTFLQKEITAITDIQSNDVVYGYIKNIANQGVFVALGRTLSGRVKIGELSDAFLKDWKTCFSIGQLVKARVISVNTDSQQIELSLKDSMVHPENHQNTIMTLDDLEVGMKVKGVIKRVESFGVFIHINDSKLSGLCHISEISDQPVKDLSKLYATGDPVKAVVLKLNKETKKISFGLKASYFDDDDFVDSESDDDEEEGDDEEDVDTMSVDEDEEEEDADEEMTDASEEEEEEEEDSDEEEPAFDDAEMMAQLEKMINGNLPSAMDSDDETSGAQTLALDDDDALQVGKGFSWTVDDEDNVSENGSDIVDSSDDEDEDEEDGDESAKSKKKSRRQKAREQREKEEKIAQREVDLLSGTHAPEVAEDFERLLLGSPNSSFLWIRYMAFQLQMAEIEKAREVAERALKMINFREEQEKMNVWVAYMNLENTYGTQESLLKVFERAITFNEPKTVYFHLVKIYERTNKMDLAAELYKAMMKKFSQSSQVWTEAGLFFLKQRNVEESRKTLQKSLQSLPKRKHIETISRFAIMEFKYGEAERGRTIFEGIMSSYPKRVDLWSVYLDMEIKCGKLDIIRRLFERVIRMKFSSKKMKFFFKKYLEFEKKFGNDDTVEHVKNAAVAYVQSLQSN